MRFLMELMVSARTTSTGRLFEWRMTEMKHAHIYLHRLALISRQFFPALDRIGGQDRIGGMTDVYR